MTEKTTGTVKLSMNTGTTGNVRRIRKTSHNAELIFTEHPGEGALFVSFDSYSLISMICHGLEQHLLQPIKHKMKLG